MARFWGYRTLFKGGQESFLDMLNPLRTLILGILFVSSMVICQSATPQRKSNNSEETLDYSPGSETIVRLDPIKKVFRRQIIVKERSLATFSVLGVPAKASMEIRLRTADGRSIYDLENAIEGDRYSASFFLTPHVYFLEGGPTDSWRASEEPLRSARLTLRIEEIEKQVLPESLRAIETWLGDVGLDKIIEVGEFVDTRNPQRGPLRSRRSFAILEDETRWAGKEHIWFMVSFLQKTDEYDLDATETAFLKTYHVGLWDRVFQKISSLEGISARRIVAIVPACKGPVVFLDASNKVNHHGLPCNAQSASLPLIARKVAKTGVTRVKPSHRSLAETVPTFLRFFMSDKARLEFLTTETNFVEVIVRGLRGHVVVGGRDWEKLQLTLAVTTGKNLPDTLRVIVDGRVASGIGEFPQDSQFTRDMEPKYSNDLSQYAKKIANALRDQLTRE